MPRLAPLVVALSTGCTAALPLPADPGPSPWPELPAEAEDYAGQGATVGSTLGAFRLPDQHGEAVDYRQFLGFATVIAVDWGWAGPSQDAAATRAALQASLQQADAAWVITVIVEGTETGPPGPEAALSWTDLFGLEDLPVVADIAWEQRLDWAIEGPTTLVVAPDGTVVHRHEAPVDDATLTVEVRALLDGWSGPLRDL